MSGSLNLNFGSTLRCSNLWHFLSLPFCSAATVAARARNTLAISNIAAVQCIIVSMSVADDYFRCNKWSVAYRKIDLQHRMRFWDADKLACHWGGRETGQREFLSHSCANTSLSIESKYGLGLGINRYLIYFFTFQISFGAKAVLLGAVVSTAAGFAGWW